ncbi:MAG: hypothetical protein AAGA40_03540 [Cyanobacteria bacterium P01_E01_bin.45]
MNRKLQWCLAIGGALAVVVGGAVVIRNQMLPCGWFDRSSGCVASAQLDIQDFGFIPDTVESSYGSFDLSAGAETVLVSLEGLRPDSTGERRHGYEVLALFDTQSGDLIRVLRGVENRAERYSDIFEVALSRDGQLAASVATDANEQTLLVQRTSDGTIVHQLISDESLFSECGGQLDFSPDNQLLQCGFNLYRLANGSLTLITDLLADDNSHPRLSDYSVSNRAIAPNGTVVDFNAIEQTDGNRTPLQFSPQLDNAIRRALMFAPDNTRFLEVQRANQPPRGFLSLFQPESSITVWNVDAEILSVLTTPTRVRRVAWSRDSQHFALLTNGLTVQVFNAPEL